ncbi:MAG: hypothetical protein K8S54_10290 [Spirochaetia bacterium]|nr:hypothetical protein [Spirochaetia bacterium]
MKLPEEKALNFQFSPKLRMICMGLILAGMVLIGLQFLFVWHPSEAAHGGHEAANPRLFMSLHLALQVALPLALGGVYFVAFNHLAGAAWCVSIRRIAENYFWFLPIVLVLMIVVFLGMGSVFSHWVHPADPNDHLLAVKRPWLNPGFFVGRNIFFVLLWLAFGFILWKKSTSQDSNPSISITRSLAKWSAVFVILFALSYSANSWDLSMSLEPHWFSTMWAPYCYAGLALTAFSSIILWIWYLKGAGYFGDSLNENHYHDMGKYMWGHSIFWAYVMICQFLLIWYAHIPEETVFYHKRIYSPTMGFQPWGGVALLLVVVRFLVPFFMIIQRKWKRNLNHLASVSVAVLVGQVIDVYWVTYPTLDNGHFIMFSWQELGPLLVVAGSFIWIVGSAMTRTSLIPKGDPRLEECLHWHQ